MRPLGGIIFGGIADRYGRKTPFVVIMLLMACSTLFIGLLPTAEHIGMLAPIMLIIFRIIQGISFGAELPAAITIISEYSSKKNTGFYSSLVISGTSVGATLASIVLMLVTTVLNSEDMNAWGWRIPFILGGILAVVSYAIRRKFEETPAFQRIQQHKKKEGFFSPFLEVIKEYRKQMILCTILNFLTSSFIIMNIYFPTFLKIFFGYPSDQIFQAMTISILGGIPIVIALGWLGDKFTQEKILCISLSLFLLFGYFGFKILYNKNFISLLMFIFLQQTYTCAFISCTLPITAIIFPTRIRFTGLGICYNLAYVIASLIPVLLTQIFEIYSNAIIVFYILSFFCIIIMYTLIKSKKLLNN